MDVEEDVWTTLQNGMRGIFARTSDSGSYMRLKSIIFNLPNVGFPPRNQDEIRIVYAKLKGFLEEKVQGVLKKGDDLSGDELVSFYSEEWEKYNKGAKVINNVWGYLNNTWIMSEISNGNEAVYPVYTMSIFVYIEDKDIFIMYYTKLLSNRLIMGASVWEGAEISFISKMKKTCGFQFTKRMAKMIGDIKSSKGQTSEFNKYMEQDMSDLPEPCFLVLGEGSWPHVPVNNFRLPPVLGLGLENFEKFYAEKHGGKRLTWSLSQSHGVLICNGFKDEKTFIATTPQITVLMLYNDSLKYTTESIADSLQMDKKLVDQTVASLVKAKVLLGDEPDEQGEYDGFKEFALNELFTHQSSKVDLSKILMPVKFGQEFQKVVQTTEVERKTVIMTTMLRIMKARKSCPSQLFREKVVIQLSPLFKAGDELIDNCIDQLIQMEHFKQTEGEVIYVSEA